MPDEIAISTKDTPGTFDAVETAKPGEPLFSLQGGDPLAPPTIHHWVKLARERARDLEGEARDRLLRRAGVAENVAWAMDEYRDGVPQVEEARPVDEVPLEVGQSAAASDRRTRLIRAVGQLHNAVAAINAVGEMLNEGGADDEDARALFAAAAMVDAAAHAIEPRRGNERS